MNLNQSPGMFKRLSKWFNSMLELLANGVADVGGIVIDWFTTVGCFTIFCMRTFRWLFTRKPSQGTLWPSLYQVGVLSMPVIMMTGTFIGMVLAVQSFAQFRMIGMETQMGAVINMSLVRELGPVLAATMLAGRVGSSMAAELGTMRVTEQIDALDSMGANPIHYLVVPRFLACLLMIPLLTIMADFMGIIGAGAYSVFLLGVDAYHYWENSRQFVSNFDMFVGLFKSIFFGGAIALIGCHRGFNSRAGAEGVGRAATSAFVYSFIVILLLDLLLGIVLDAAYYSIWPETNSIF